MADEPKADGAMLGVIPARYASTRFPGKPLAVIGGKTMIRRVWEQAKKAAALAEVVVATDDERIRAEVESFGGRALMTDPDHPSGTDRCFEVFGKAEGGPYAYVVNIQGDEPFVRPEQLDLLAETVRSGAQLATLVRKITQEDALFNPNEVRVVFDKDNHALYFSRYAIPYARGVEEGEKLSRHAYYKHIGLYAYRADVLAEIAKLAPSPLERAEALEQLRWLENGYRIKVGVTPYESVCIDVPEDVERVLRLKSIAEEFGL